MFVKLCRHSFKVPKNYFKKQYRPKHRANDNYPNHNFTNIETNTLQKLIVCVKMN